MRALVVRGARDIVVEERPEPSPGAGEVLLRPLFNGICFTDKHVHMGFVTRSRSFVLGHEFSAEVMALGAGVRHFAPGDLVSVDPRLRCGECLPCRAGLETLCATGGFMGINGPDGGLSDLCVVPEYCLYHLPAGCSPLQAACVEAACCGTRAVRSGAVAVGDNVLVLGLEDYNLYAAHWLRNHGLQIIGVDPAAERRKAARAFGIDIALDPAAENVEAQVRQQMPFGADVVFVSVEDYVPEAEDYLRMAYALARPQGTIVQMRAYGGKPYVQPNPVVPWVKELTIRHFGSFFGNEPARGGRARGDWQVTLDAIARGTLLAPPPEHALVPFSSLAEKAEVDALFDGLPLSHSKIIVDMSA